MKRYMWTSLLSAEGISCSECGSSNMEYIGEKLIRQEIHVTEPKVVVYDIYQKTYKCLECSDDEHTSITVVPAPNALVPHSPVSASSMTAVILNKYLFALPLNRQEKLWSMLHLDIGKSTMANWIQYSYRLYLRHIDQQMHKYLLQEGILHADETLVQVMKEPKIPQNLTCGFIPRENLHRSRYVSSAMRQAVARSIPLNS